MSTPVSHVSSNKSKTNIYYLKSNGTSKTFSKNTRYTNTANKKSGNLFFKNGSHISNKYYVYIKDNEIILSDNAISVPGYTLESKRGKKNIHTDDTFNILELAVYLNKHEMVNYLINTEPFKHFFWDYIRASHIASRKKYLSIEKLLHDKIISLPKNISNHSHNVVLSELHNNS